MGFHPGDVFRIQDERRNGVARLGLRGELDFATAPKLEEHLMLVEQEGVRAVLLDLRDLTFVDSVGLRTFLEAKIRAAENGHRFALVGANDQVKRILYVTAIQGILDEQEGVQLLARFARPSSLRTSGAAVLFRYASR
jgi:anti-anti-sigma factor